MCLLWQRWRNYHYYYTLHSPQLNPLLNISSRLNPSLRKDIHHTTDSRVFYLLYWSRRTAWLFFGSGSPWIAFFFALYSRLRPKIHKRFQMVYFQKAMTLYYIFIFIPSLILFFGIRLPGLLINRICSATSNKSCNPYYSNPRPFHIHLATGFVTFANLPVQNTGAHWLSATNCSATNN